MNVYIGGPLNGFKQSKLFHKIHKKDYFDYLDARSGMVTTYYKIKMNLNGEVKRFWVTEEFLQTDISKLIEAYMDTKV